MVTSCGYISYGKGNSISSSLCVKVCFLYLGKLNKAAVGLHPLLMYLTLISHDITDLFNRHEHPFFVVLHCPKDDVGQVQQQLDLEQKYIEMIFLPEQT